MGKGGYIGGGTIIGPHTPDWFGQGDDEQPAPAPGPQTSPARSFPEPGTQKTTRNQRRKRAKARATQPGAAGPMTRPVRAELTPAAQRQIDTLRIDIKGLESQLASCQQALDRCRGELNDLLRKHGLPLDKPNNQQRGN